MAKNYVQEGKIIEYTAGATIASGDLVVIGVRVGVALVSMVSGDVGSVAMSGVFEVPKEAPLVISQGDLLYCDATSGELDKTSSAQTLAGYAWADAASADTTVKVKLNG